MGPGELAPTKGRAGGSRPSWHSSAIREQRPTALVATASAAGGDAEESRHTAAGGAGGGLARDGLAGQGRAAGRAAGGGWAAARRAARGLRVSGLLAGGGRAAYGTAQPRHVGGRGGRSHSHRPGEGSRRGRGPGDHSRPAGSPQRSWRGTWWPGGRAGLGGPSPAAFVTRAVCPGSTATVCAVDAVFTFLSPFWVSSPARKPHTECSLGGGRAVTNSGLGLCWAGHWALLVPGGDKLPGGLSVLVHPSPRCPWGLTLVRRRVSAPALRGVGHRCSAPRPAPHWGLFLWRRLGVLPAGVGSWSREGGRTLG